MRVPQNARENSPDWPPYVNRQPLRISRPIRVPAVIGAFCLTICIVLHFGPAFKTLVKFYLHFFTEIMYSKISMDRKQFSSMMPGRLVNIAHPELRCAFIPNPLPPRWKWPTGLWQLLMEARTSLARLDGTGRHLPNPEIILKPLQRREAQLSSQLEGTITDPKQQVLFQADPKYPESEKDPANAFREVFNYGRALRLRLDGQNELPLSLRLIKELHAQLMEGVRGSDQRPGEFRTIQNQIGWPIARFVPPPPEELASALDAFEKYLHSSSTYDALVKAFLAHYQFETIHPFRDGNGRVGRLLLALTIAEWCNLSNQWLYMSAFFEKRKAEYMDLMLGVSTDGEWEPWIKFCLEGVVAQSTDAEKRCEKLLKLYREFHRRLKGGSVRLSRMVDKLFDTPVMSVKRYKEAFRVTYPTARADLKKLQSHGIVNELENVELITYYSPSIYAVTYEDIV
jgi:Fic family protein